jgi:hypothetical protein
MRVKLIAVSLIGLFLVSALSPTVLIPPRDLSDPRQVFLIDHGTHTSIAVETNQETFIRYAYGDKNYYALRNTDLSSGARALLMPTDAVLARAELAITPSVEGVIDGLPVVVQKVYPLQVEGSKADQLISSLDEIFAEGKENLIEVPAYGLDFVPHPDDYSWVNNSSTMIASWMRQMEITTIGWGLLAYWRDTN